MGPLLWLEIVTGTWICYHVLLCIYNLFFHPLRAFPGPKLDAISQLKTSYHLVKGDYSKHIAGLHERYGEVVRTGPRELSYATATAFMEIHGNKSNAEHVYEKNPVAYVQGSGEVLNIFFARHKEHIRYRKLMSTAFSDSAIREQEPLIRAYVDKFILSMRNHSGLACYPDRDGIANIAAWYNFIIFDLLSSLAFGAPVGCLDKGDYHPWVRLFYGAAKHSTFIQAAHRLNPYGKILERLMPKGVESAYEEHMDFSRRTLVERQKQGELARRDFLSFFMKGLSQEELVDNVNILVVAGGETTATALTSITYYITHNSHAYEKLTKEIRESFEKEEDITIGEVQKLKYLKAVIEESLRIHPPVVVGLPRIVPKGGRYIDGRFVPGGTWVSVSTLACCRLSKNFRDPEKFIPERWLGDSRFDSDYREAFHPFLMGSRACIASYFATVNIRLILARLLWNFDVEGQPDNQDPHEQKESGIWEGVPLRIRIVERVMEPPAQT